jgi:hypothetical protein
MTYRRTPFAPSEHYHCYTRGIDGRTVFEKREDFERFQEALYLCNSIEKLDRNNFLHYPHEKIFTIPRNTPLVAIGSYSLMSNHFHIEFKECVEGGASKFLQKFGTSYSMYFNTQHARIGSLFLRPCRSKHIADDRYLKQVTQYIHLNAAELYEHDWKRGVVKDIRGLEKKLADYPFSSLRDYVGPLRPERSILDQELMNLIRNDLPPLAAIISEARKYYQNLKY